MKAGDHAVLGCHVARLRAGHRWVVGLVSTLVLGMQAPAMADIYMYVDPAGRVWISDSQEHSGYARVVEEVDRPAATGRPPIPATDPRDGGDERATVSRADIERMAAGVAATHGLEPELVHAIIAVESGFDPRAVSPKGAMGLMQLMPATGRRFGVSEPFNARQNVMGGVRYFRYLLDLFDQDLELALAAYNAGEGAVLRSGRRIPPYAETQRYVPKVLDIYQQRRRRSQGNGPVAVL